MTTKRTRSEVGILGAVQVSARAAATILSLVPDSDSRVWQIYAETHEVRGRTGARFVLLVRQCPRCGCTHIHTARLSFTSGIRSAACGARYVIHADTSATGGAA